jgi:hypothetical protein
MDPRAGLDVWNRCTGIRTTDHPACSLVSITTALSTPARVATTTTEPVRRIVTNRLAPRSASSFTLYCLRVRACVPLVRVVDAKLFFCPLKWCKVRTLRCGHIAERCERNDVRFCVRRMCVGRDQHPAARRKVRQMQSVPQELYSMLTELSSAVERLLGPFYLFLVVVAVELADSGFNKHPFVYLLSLTHYQCCKL